MRFSLKRNFNHRIAYKGFTPTPESHGCKIVDECRRIARKQKNHGCKSVVWGFTLVETILYVAILAIFLLLSFLAIEPLLSSNNQSRDSVEVNEDAEFILGKLNWALSGASYVREPATNTAAAILETVDGLGTSYRFEPLGDYLTLALPGGAPFALNSSSTKVALFAIENIYDIDTDETIIKIKFKVERQPGQLRARVTSSTTIETSYAIYH